MQCYFHRQTLNYLKMICNSVFQPAQRRQGGERGLRSRWRENRTSGKCCLPRIPYQHQRQWCAGNQEADGDGPGAGQKMVSTLYIWKSRGLSLGLKVRFLRATAFPIAIYGCESWAMTSGDKKRVDAFELWCYRRLLSVSQIATCLEEEQCTLFRSSNARRINGDSGRGRLCPWRPCAAAACRRALSSQQRGCSRCLCREPYNCRH